MLVWSVLVAIAVSGQIGDQAESMQVSPFCFRCISSNSPPSQRSISQCDICKNGTQDEDIFLLKTFQWLPCSSRINSGLLTLVYKGLQNTDLTLPVPCSDYILDTLAAALFERTKPAPQEPLQPLSYLAGCSYLYLQIAGSLFSNLSSVTTEQVL